MERGDSTRVWPQPALLTRPAPRFNVLSVVAPVLGVLVGCVVFYVLNNHFNWWAGRAVDAGIRTLGWFVILGFACAVIALVRRESWWGITAVALAVNGVVLLSFWVKQTSLWPGLWPEP